MRVYLAIILLFVATHSTFAQSDTVKKQRLIMYTPSRGRLVNHAFIAILVKDRQIYKSDTTSNSLKILSIFPPKIIVDIKVLWGTNATTKYGDMAKYGALEIFVDKKKDRKAYRMFSRQLKEVPKDFSN